MVSGCSAAMGRASRLHDGRSTSDSTPAVLHQSLQTFPAASLTDQRRLLHLHMTLLMLHASNLCCVNDVDVNRGHSTRKALQQVPHLVAIAIA